MRQKRKLIVKNGRELTPADTAAIKAMRLHLLALAAYVVPAEVEAAL